MLISSRAGGGEVGYIHIFGASCRELGSVHITQEKGHNNGLMDIRQSAFKKCYIEQDRHSLHMQA